MKKGETRSVLIFGGAGFIGSNLAHDLLTRTDAKVHVFDNLSRAGVAHNLEWLRKAAGNSGRLRITLARSAWAVRITITPGAIETSAKLAEDVRRNQAPLITVDVVAVDAAGQGMSSPARIKPRS